MIVKFRKNKDNADFNKLLNFRKLYICYIARVLNLNISENS